MKYVITKSKQEDFEARKNVLKLEIDYELVNLYDALQIEDDAAIKAAKNRLRTLVYELNTLNYKMY